MRKCVHNKITKQKPIKNERKNAHCQMNRDNFGETSFNGIHNRNEFGKKNIHHTHSNNTT